jgi:S-DNA-T family DNA segregation ATPase FtsK/SpoIIIE
MVGTLRQAAERLAILPPRHPWLDELAPRYDFALLPNPRTDAKLLLGVADSPSTQSQPTAFYEPDVDGNLAVYGTGGAGKSATLRALAVAAAVTPRGGPVQVYGLDFGSRGLRPLEDLPHVAAVVDGDDQEGVARVLRRIRDLVDQRASRFAAVRADSIAEYRARAQAPDEARVLLLVDGLSAFREAYENATSPEFAMFAQIAADGRGVGVHVVLTADRPSAVPTSIAATVQRRLVLRMASDDDYTMLGVPRDVLAPTSPPGRGLLDGQELQVAILGGSPNLAVQARELTRLAESMRRHGVRPAPPVRRLPALVTLSELAVGGAGLVVGLDDETLEAAVVAPSGTLLVSGPPGAGRSTTLATIAAAVRRQQPERRTVLLSPRRSVIAGLGMFTEAHTSLDAVESAAARIADDIASGRQPAGSVAVFVESLADLADTSAEAALRRLVAEAVRADDLVVAETESSTWGQAYGLSGPFKAGRRGILLVPSDVEGDVLLNTPLGRFRAADMPPGRGFVVAGGRGRRVQVALPE